MLTIVIDAIYILFCEEKTLYCLPSSLLQLIGLRLVHVQFSACSSVCGGCSFRSLALVAIKQWLNAEGMQMYNKLQLLMFCSSFLLPQSKTLAVH